MLSSTTGVHLPTCLDVLAACLFLLLYNSFDYHLSRLNKSMNKRSVAKLFFEMNPLLISKLSSRTSLQQTSQHCPWAESSPLLHKAHKKESRVKNSSIHLVIPHSTGISQAYHVLCSASDAVNLKMSEIQSPCSSDLWQFLESKVLPLFLT